MYADVAQRLRQIVHVDATVAIEVEALEDLLQPLLGLGRQLVQVMRRRWLDDRARRRRRAYTRTAAVSRHMYVATFHYATRHESQIRRDTVVAVAERSEAVPR